MASKHAAAAAAAAPSSSSEEDGDSSSGVSTTSHEQEVADEEMGEKESSVEESESELDSEEEEEEEEWGPAPAAAVKEEGEDSTEEGDDEEEEPDPQPSSKRVNPPLTAAVKEEVQEDVDLQPIKRVDERAPVLPAESEDPAAKNQPQPNNSPARDRKRASCEVGKTAHHIDPPEPRLKRARRVWGPGDEVLILKALAEHRREHGELPAWGDCDFFESVREGLEDGSFHHSDVKDKARSLLRRYISRVEPTTDHGWLIHSLSRDVWGDLPPIADASGSINGSEEADDVPAILGAENGCDQSDDCCKGYDTKGFKKMCEKYPLLAQEVKLLAEAQPGQETAFTRLDAKRALHMEKKLERVKYEELKIKTRVVLEVLAPKAKITKKLLSLLTKVSKN